MKRKVLILALGLFLILAGCSPVTEDIQPDHPDFVPLQSGQTIGQTFTAHFDGLGGVGLLLKPEIPGTGEIKLSLHTSPETLDHLREARLPISSFSYPGYSYFYFPPLSDSDKKDYYLTLRLDGEGSVSVGMGSPDTYIDGSIYQNGRPGDGQLTLRLVYGIRRLIAGLVQQELQWLLWIIIAIFLFILPGWALLSLTYPDWESFGFWWKFGLSSGLSLAIYPLLFLWTGLVGLNLGSFYAWLPGSLGAIVLLYRAWRNIHRGRSFSLRSIRFNLPSLAMLFMVGLITWSRFWVIRGLDIPLWGDSYQHTIITQLLVDHGGLFKSWLPYADLQSFTYHFGYHSLVAVFHWLSQMAIPQAMLWTGQIVNILAVVALYPLTLRITKNPWSGVFSVLLAGLVFSMPMFYLNWGRYTQLAGLVLLPAFVLIAWNFLDRHQFSWPLLLLAWITLGALAITHIRVLIFAIIFLAVYFVIDFQHDRWKNTLLRMAMICLGGVVLALPWIVNVESGKLIDILTHHLTTSPSQLPASSADSNEVTGLFFYLPSWAWVTLPIVIGIGLWKRNKNIALIASWWYLILLAANPQWFNLPGADVITSFAVIISLYFPASILFAALFGWVIDALQRPKSKVFTKIKVSMDFKQKGLPVVIFGVVLLISIIGLRERIGDLQTASHSLTTRPDLRAARWITNNIPSQAGFLVNSTFAYNGSAIVGTDGGWWLSYLTDRRSSLPPLPYASEAGLKPDYTQWINKLTSLIQTKGITDPTVLKELKDRGLEYIYIGQEQGLVNSSAPLLKLDQLISNSIFTPIYHQDRVWIFRINED